MILKTSSYPLALIALLCLLTMGDKALAGGAPTTFHASKDFRSLIIQGERPEIVTCMIATRRFVKNTTEFEDLRWLNTLSQTALLNEKEVNGQLIRTIVLQAQVLPDSHEIFEIWKPVQVQCKQVDEGYPIINITISGNPQ